MAYSRARRLAQFLQSDGTIAAGKIPADAIDSTKIADDAVDSEHYTNTSIDTAHIADDQVTLAKMAGLARGTIIYGDSSGNPTALAVGSSGQALTSDGTDVFNTKLTINTISVTFNCPSKFTSPYNSGINSFSGSPM